MRHDSPESRPFDVEDGHGHRREGLVKRVDHEKNGGELSSGDANRQNQDGNSCEIEEKEVSIEQIFDDKKVPPWWEQITFRAMFLSMLLGIMFCIIVMKLSLTTGVIPSLNVAAGLLGFFFIKAWTKFLEKFGLLKTPFTRQENTVIQTCVVACYGLAFSGGFGSYILAMTKTIYNQSGTGSAGNTPDDIKEPSLSWIIGFLFTVAFMGLLAVVPLRKIMVIDYKLTYPSGTATAILINGFHTPQGDQQARKQVRALGKFFTLSFLWSFFQWFFTATDACGFQAFPTFGLQAFTQEFYFDFSATYIGAGMLCPHLVNLSILFGAVISWGLMWPLIDKHKGDWYTAADSSMQGLKAYKVFVAIALILGDGLYNFVKIMLISGTNLYSQSKEKRARNGLPVVNSDGNQAAVDAAIPYDEQRRNEIFMKDSIPLWVAGAGYVALAAISIGVIPRIFHPVKWYFVLVAYIMAPVFAFCNAYGCGLTDWSMVTAYGKLAIFIFGAWAGKDHEGILAGLATCGVMMVIVSTAADLMQDFKTGYLTLSSPRSMFLSQVIGTAMGCIIAPLSFWLFWKAFHVGDQTGDYKAPNGLLFRSIAIIAVEGFGALPKNCLNLCYGFFAVAIVINLIRDRVPKKVSQYIPLPMAMAIPFYIGGYFGIDMCVGTAIVFVWQKMNRKQADVMVPAVAAGLLCGDGVWSLPSAILALAKINPPICMKFLSRSVNTNVDTFLGNS
eukprot:PITA_31056